MKKLYKIFISLFFMFLIILTYVNASNINMNLENITPQNTISVLEDFSNESESLNTSNNTVTNSGPRVTTTVDKNDEEFLNIENVLSIIIIVIGILLIFLAVAILIRFR